jgi:hypothetical protein
MGIPYNTVMLAPTYLLNAVGVIEKGRKDFNIPSENWPYPAGLYLGTPTIDKYYTEVWIDGMDWQNTYWLVESERYEDPIAIPLVIFENHKEESKIDTEDLSELFRGLMWVRRSKLLDEKLDLGIYCDYLSCICKIKPEVIYCSNSTNKLKMHHFKLGKQSSMRFFLNQDVFHIGQVKRNDEVEQSQEEKTFVERCVLGEVQMCEINDFVARWHGSLKGSITLHNFLGMTWTEYCEWVKDPNVLPAIIEVHKNEK